jgi:hypothetical protein
MLRRLRECSEFSVVSVVDRIKATVSLLEKEKSQAGWRPPNQERSDGLGRED